MKFILVYILWFIFQGANFGYSPVNYVRQGYYQGADFSDTNYTPNGGSNPSGTGGDKKLSWPTNGIDGGWRLGRTHSLHNSNDYKKIIFLKN